MTIRMGYWDCPSCGHKKNLGPNATCAGCGRPRGPNLAFYTDEDAPVIEDPELVRRARAGADWKCKFCGADNRAGVMDCHQCGAGPDGTVARAQRFVPLETAKTKSKLPIILAIVGAVLALLLGGVYFLFIRTHAVTMTVESVAWVRSAALEERETVRDGAWRDEVPAGARTISTETRGRDKRVQDGTEKIKVGKKDLGNGMFEDVYKEQPKYITKKVDDAWVTYEMEKWVVKRTLREQTSDGSEPRDPKRQVSPGANQRFADERSEYAYELKGGDGKRYTYEADASRGKPFAVGAVVPAKVNGAGSVVSMGP